MAKTRPTPRTSIRKPSLVPHPLQHQQYLNTLIDLASVRPVEQTADRSADCPKDLPPKAAPPTPPQAIDLAELRHKDIKLILVLPAGDTYATDATAIRSFVHGSTPLFDGVPIYSKPRLADQLDVYGKMIEASYIELVPVRHKLLNEAGFRSCYVDEDGKANGKAHNAYASEMCDVHLVGRALFFRK